MQETGERWRLGHRPALDGLRGVAVLLVLGGHAMLLPSNAGPVGVTAFFALSGFLITALFLDEREKTGRLSMSGFYRRRALRLVPALACYLLAMLALTLAGVAAFDFPIGEYFGPVLYVQNWLMALRGYAPHATAITWSLSVEEQFYLLWPLAMLAGRRWPRLPVAVAASGLVAAQVLRLMLWHGGAGAWRVYYGTDTRMDCLLAGCLLAFAVKRFGAPMMLRGAWPVGTAALVAAVFVANSTVSALWSPLLVAVAACLMIAAVLAGGATWLSLAPLRWFGKRSYALYLWHYPIVYVFARTEHQLPMWLAIGLSLLAAEASFRFVEQPFLRLKGRATGSPRPADSTPVPTATAATLAA